MARVGEKRNTYFLRCQYRGFWCPDNERNQGISSYGIDIFLPKHSGLSISSVAVPIFRLWCVYKFVLHTSSYTNVVHGFWVILSDICQFI